MSKKKIPKGWINYLPFGDRVEGTKLFPFKTPLKLELQHVIPKEQRFTPACLIANRPKLRAVIDLTDTDARADRYYNPKDFIDAKVEHLKMRISGGGLVPGMDKIELFSNAVDGFMKKFSDDPDALIGVHCTHGLNRTGYFICMYMVTRMSFSPIEAIDNFQKARGYEMYRQNFLEEIMQPGKHTSGRQTPRYCEDKKPIRTVGNYQYKNTWLKENSNKSSKKNCQSVTSNGGTQYREQNEASGRRVIERGRHWSEGGQRSEFSRSGHMKRPYFSRDPREDNFSFEGRPYPIDSSAGQQYGGERLQPEGSYDRRNPFIGDMIGNSPYFDADRRKEDTPLLLNPFSVGRIQTGHDFSQERDSFPIGRSFAGGQNRDFPVGVGHFSQIGVENATVSQETAQYPFQGSQRIDFSHTNDFVGRHHSERSPLLNRKPCSTGRSQGVDFSSLEMNLGWRQFTGGSVQGPQRPFGGHRKWKEEGERGGSVRHEGFSYPEIHRKIPRNQMEYRSPLEEDGFQEVSNHRRYRSHRGRRRGGGTS